MVNALTVIGLFLCLIAAPVAAADLAFERAVDIALTSPILSADVVKNARDACDTALCFAESLARDLPDKVRLEAVAHPDTDSIRRATTTPSVITHQTGTTRTLKLPHFGRKATAELREALANAGEYRAVELDLRGNPGGDFERMLEIAGLLIGARQDVVEIEHGDRVERRSLEGPHTHPWRVTKVWIDEKTASAALFLARLLAASGGAELIGPDHGTPIFLKRRITIDHDWRLVLPVAVVRVAGSG